MSDINSSRVPLLLILWPLLAYTGDEDSTTLNRGDKWAQHPSNDVTPNCTYALILAFAESLVR
jgi:hypothetical protein